MTDEEKLRLDTDGYLVLDNLMDASLLDTVRQRVEELFEHEGAQAGAEFKLEPHARRLQPNPLDVTGGCDAGLGAEGAREVPGAHVRARCHRLDGVVLGDVVGHEAKRFAQRLARGLLGDECCAELGLTSRAAQEQHEPAGDGEGGLAVEVLLDERQRQVHPGGHAG